MIMPVDVLIIDVRAVVVIALEPALSVSYAVDVLPDELVDVLIDALAGVIIGIATGIGVGILAGAKINVLAALSCWPMAVLDCTRALQAWMPSYHVCSRFALPALPQFPNQEPPRPQQLILPDFLMLPHLGHTELMVVVMAVGV